MRESLKIFRKFCENSRNFCHFAKFSCIALPLPFTSPPSNGAMEDSAYEQMRKNNIAQNNRVLEELGLGPNFLGNKNRNPTRQDQGQEQGQWQQWQDQSNEGHREIRRSSRTSATVIVAPLADPEELVIRMIRTGPRRRPGPYMSLLLSPSTVGKALALPVTPGTAVPGTTIPLRSGRRHLPEHRQHGSVWVDRAARWQCSRPPSPPAGEGGVSQVPQTLHHQH